VGRRLIFAAVLLGAAAGSARADWQVHRDGKGALLQRAEQALRDDPDDDRVARRLVQLVGHGGAGALRERFRARAEGPSGYAPREAYAQLLLASGDAKAAVAAFDRALGASPDAPGALAGRARALAAAGSGDASAAFEAAIARARRPAEKRRLVEEALAAIHPGSAEGTRVDARRADLERTVALRRELARLGADSDADAEHLADALAEAGRPAEAAAVLERRLAPDRPEAKLALALRAARLRLADHDPADAAHAADGLRRLLDALPREASSSRRAVWTCAWQIARGRGTLSALADELARTPGPVEWDLLGQVRDELGDLEGALAATERARAAAPRDAELGRRWLGLLERLGRDDDALAAATELARKFPADIGFAVGLGDRQFRHRDRAGVAATFDRALARFTREPTALETLAEAATRWGEDQRARAAWTRLVRVDPSSEVAIVGLGEAEFQAGKRADAHRTWAKLQARAATPAAGHLRFGEILFDHDLVEEALVEARRAEAADPGGAAPHRLLAQIAERERRLDDAVAEWRHVLAAASRGEEVGVRREARMHLLGLCARQGRGKLPAEVARLREEVRAHPDDVETALFLAEGEQRLGDLMGAMSTLRAIVARGGQGADSRWREAAVEAGFALARILKQTGQPDAAAEELATLARLAPDRARDAELQIAEIALARYDIPGALAHAAAAAAGADAAQLARIADIRARAGDEAGARTTYRQALAVGAAPPAALALAQLLGRNGEADAAADVLERLLRATGDDAALADASRLALGIEESLGRLPALAEALVADPGDARETSARRRALVDVLERMLPPLLADPAANATRARLGREVLRPLLDLVVATEAPDPRALQLLGLLGDADAVPALCRVAARPPADGRGAAAVAAAEARQAALVALGRLADPRAISTLAAAAAGPPAARAAAIWGLGRIADDRARALVWRAVDDPRPEVQALACLGLGRSADRRAVALLGRVASDGIRPTEVRRAAALALGRAGGAEAATTLLELLEAADAPVSQAAAVALAWTRDARAVPALLTRALLADGGTLASVEPARAALDVWVAGAPPPDEARAILGNELAPSEILAALTAPPLPTDLAPLLRARTGEVDGILGEALARGGALRRAALEALDARADGPGLGALLPADPLPAETASVLREIAWPLADGVAAALEDPDRRSRAAALRLLAKLDDDRLTPARLAEAVRDGAPALADAAVMAARLLVRAHPASVPAIAAAIAPLAADDNGGTGSWTSRLAAVQLLAALGPAGLSALDHAVADRNPLVRAAAIEALGRACSGG
jgi:predicted Zn-dependent protease